MDAIGATKDDVKVHTDRSQHTCSSQGEIDASACHDDHMNSLVDDVEALKDVDNGVIVVVISCGDAEMVHQGVVTLHTDE